MLLLRVGLVLIALLAITVILRMVQKAWRSADVKDPVEAKQDVMQATIDTAETVNENENEAFTKAQNKIDSLGGEK